MYHAVSLTAVRVISSIACHSPTISRSHSSTPSTRLYFSTTIGTVRQTHLAMSAAPVSLNVLVTGAGLVGKAVLDGLLDPELKRSTVVLFLLVRPASLVDPSKRETIHQYAARGVVLVEGDVEDIAGMTRLLQAHAIHTVVCVVGFSQGSLHYPLIEACKAAGVRHFLPSDYTIDSDAVPAGSAMYDTFARPKQAVHLAVRQSGMEWTFIATGVFVEAALLFPIVGVNVTSRTITAPDSFDTVLTMTPVREIGLLTAAAVLDPAARNKQLYFGRLYTFEQLAQALEQATGDRVVRKVRTVEEMQATLEQQPMDETTRLALAQVHRAGTTWPDSQTYRHGQINYPSLLSVAQRVINGGYTAGGKA